VERSGDGSGGEDEDIGGHAELEEALFVLDAEALFFVDDDEAEVGEADVF